MPNSKVNSENSYKIKIITSDITYMKDTFCVAGWSPSTSEMKRLMISGRHWENSDLKKIGKYASMNVTIIPKEGGRNYPHKTEDTWISDNFGVNHTFEDPKHLAKTLKFSVSGTIAQAFKGKLKEHSHVPFKTECPSLGAVIVPAANIEFFKKDSKLRVKVLDNDNQEYDLRVTCKYLRDMMDEMSGKDFNEFAESISKSYDHAHVRVGLAKPYVYKDSNCYLMCNGIFFYDE